LQNQTHIAAPEVQKLGNSHQKNRWKFTPGPHPKPEITPEVHPKPRITSEKSTTFDFGKIIPYWKNRSATNQY